MIHSDSRQIRPGDTFVAVRGAAQDGAHFIPQAIAAGAVKIVSENPRAADCPASVAWEQVADSREAAALLACRQETKPSHELGVFAVTGTNGKTTIANLVRRLLSAGGVPCGLLSTIENDTYPLSMDPAWHTAEPAKNTTAGPFELQRSFRAMLVHGCHACAMEVSSHALDQKRVFGTHFACTIFTNLTQDHLDYHGTMEAYFAAKAKLFLEYDTQACVVNGDDPYGRRLLEAIRRRGESRVLSYGFSDGCDLRIADLRFSADGMRFTLVHPEGRSEIVSRLFGRHNALNLAAALAAASFCAPMETLVAATERLRPVRGRLDPVRVPGSPAAFFVDYAHTPDALENVLRTLRELTPGRLFVVFGAGGDRDRTKRPLMGRACAALADRLIVTSDNPRSEEPASIIGDILGGIGDARDRTQVEPDRREALRLAVREANREGDVVLVAGKGHEDYQIFADRTIHFDDREELVSAGYALS